MSSKRPRSVVKTLQRDLVNGALAGAVGAACMTPLRLTARRMGLVDKMTPQMIEEALAERLGIGQGRDAEVHHVADHLLHFGFGAFLGLAYALPTGRRRAGTVPRGLAFGVLAWLFGAGVVVPLLGAHRPPWRARVSENAVNVAAHLVFGVTTALVVEELTGQSDRRPASSGRRSVQRVG
jgi:uncharacterized membrane protein YagU involved in acid resistance